MQLIKESKVTFGLGNHQGLVLENNGNYRDIKRPPYHMCAFKSDIAKNVKFREVYSDSGQSVEDFDWLRRLYPRLNTEAHIPKILHRYRYSSETTASIK